MKLLTSLFTVTLSVSLAVGQIKYETFGLQKKSIDLSTGICMSYIDTGNPKGTPVLLLHGVTDTSRSFQLVIDDLKKLDENLRIIAPDLRGHGNTSMPVANNCQEEPEQCFSPAQQLCDVIDLMDKLNLSKAYVVGHSMGSVLAQRLALSEPHRVAGMVLMGTFVNGEACAAIHDFMLGDMLAGWKRDLENDKNIHWPGDVYSFSPKSMGEKVMNYLRENWVTEPAAAKEFLEAILPETLAVPLGTWIGAIKSLGVMDNRAALEKLTIPTLILWAAHDEVTSAKDQVQVREAFRAAATAQHVKIFYKVYDECQADGPDAKSMLTHNFHWAAHQDVANDIHSFIATGKPNMDTGHVEVIE